MILKIVSENGVQLFDGFDQVSARDLSDNEPIGVSSDSIDFTDRPLTEQEATFVKAEIWLYKQGANPRQIIAFKPVYVLSNDGKTVDKL